MENLTEVRVVTFEDIIAKMVETRNEGGTGIIKRENFRDFPHISKAIGFGIAAFPFASFGYIERLIRKLAVEYSNTPFSKLNIIKYREACGFFSGELEIFAETTDKKISEKIKFSWAGNGPIEETWDNFVEWETRPVTDQ